MPTLHLFILPDELQEMIRLIAAKHQLRAVVESDNELTQCLGSEIVIRNDANARGEMIYLIPDANFEAAFTDRENLGHKSHGWLRVFVGSIRTEIAVLTMTQIDTTDQPNLPFKPSVWMRSLRHILSTSPSINFGATGINERWGGSSYYSDLGFSERAVELLTQGYKWKQEPFDNGIFQPSKLEVKEK